MLGRLFIKNQDSLGYVEASRQSNLLEWPEARGYCKIESMTGQTLVDLDRVSTLYHNRQKQIIWGRMFHISCHKK